MAKLQPHKFGVNNCHRNCTINVHRLPGKIGELVHQWYEDGNNDYEIVRKAAVMDVRLSTGSVSRHRKNHLFRTDVDRIPDPSEAPNPAKYEGKLTDLEVVERIIAAGADQLAIRGIRISPEMTLRAIEMKYKLTQGSVFEGFLGAIGAVNEEAIKEEAAEATSETIDAVASADEQAQVEAVASVV